MENKLILPCNPDEVSDGYHTFGELYEFRKLYNALLFNEWAVQHKYDVHKSKRHHDGELCFGGEWFIVVAVLPTGQISNHYKMEDWGLFIVPEREKATYEYDGHTAQDVLERMRSLAKREPMVSFKNSDDWLQKIIEAYIHSNIQTDYGLTLMEFMNAISDWMQRSQQKVARLENQLESTMEHYFGTKK